MELKEKIELYIKYAESLFEQNSDVRKVYTTLINREDLLEQLDKTTDEFWNQVKKQKILYVFTDSTKWKLGSEKKDEIITKFLNFHDKKGAFPALVYEKQMEDIYSKKLYRPI